MKGKVRVLLGLICLVSLTVIGCTRQQSNQIRGHIILKNTEISDQFEIPKDSDYSNGQQLDGLNLTAEEEKAELIVQFHGSSQQVRNIVNKYNLKVHKEITQLGIKLVTGAQEAEELLHNLRQEAIVTGVASNHTVQLRSSLQDLTVNDKYYYKQWHYPAISLPPVWAETFGNQQANLKEVTVAVVDTGVDREHPDLEANLIEGKDFVDGDQELDNLNEHGTHVAGIIGAATNNQRGVAGINWQVNIMPIRVLDNSGAGSVFDIIKGITWAVDQGADVINLSLGSSFPNKFYQEAVEYAAKNKVVVVAASGNGGYDNYNQPQGNPEVGYPARYEHVISVGAVDSDLELTYYSNYGKQLDFVAPGHNIYSTTINGYKFKSGTSMATPQVAGLAALIKASGEADTPEEIKKQLKLTAQDLGPQGRDLEYGYGLINAYAAVMNAEITKTKVFIGQKDGESIRKQSKTVHPTDEGTYQLPALDAKNCQIYGWLDVDGDDTINKGDYFGSSEEVVNSRVNVNFSLRLITDESLQLTVDL